MPAKPISRPEGVTVEEEFHQAVVTARIFYPTCKVEPREDGYYVYRRKRWPFKGWKLALIIPLLGKYAPGEIVDLEFV